MMYNSLNDIIEQLTRRDPKALCYRFLDRFGEEQSLTAESLYNEVNKLTVLLQYYINPKDRVILAARPGLEFIIGFYACLRANGIAVPIFPPANTQMASRLRHVLNDAKPALILCDEKTTKEFKKGLIITKMMPKILIKKMGVNETYASFFNLLKQLKIKLISTEMRSQTDEVDVKHVSIQPEDIAFLQYTSGSTTNPKGVMLSHANVLDNVQIIKRALDHSASSHMFSWLPPYHDMGLIAGIIEPLYANIIATSMSPVDFIRQPSKWVEYMSQYKCTTTGAPNFGFELCTQKTSDQIAQQLDLSHLEIAANGAEPVSFETIKKFNDKFKSSGLKERAVFPCYGLAECTVMVSAKHFIKKASVLSVCTDQLEANKIVIAEKSDRSTTFVSAGIPQMEVKIVNPETRSVCAEMQVGEIWVNGKSIASGYFNNSSETQKVFHHILNSVEKSKKYLATGDLGFIYEKELYVCGRLKDLIIINGRNYYPQDIESTVSNAHPSIKRGSVIAYSLLENHHEQLYIVSEIREAACEADYLEVISEVQKRITSSFSLTVNSVFLIKPKTLPKTTSGKLQRKRCAEMVKNNTLPILFHYQNDASSINDFIKAKDNWLPELKGKSFTEKKQIISAELAELIKQLMHLPDTTSLDPQIDIRDLGIDSILLTQLVQNVNEALGYQVTLDELEVINKSNILELSEWIVTSLDKAGHEISGTKGSHELISTDFLPKRHYRAPPQQISFYLSDLLSPDKASYNITAVLKFNRKPDESNLLNALSQVIESNPVLGSQFEPKNDHVWVTEIQGLVSDTYYSYQRSSKSNLKKQFDKNQSKNFNLNKAPLFHIYLIESANKYYLQIVIHHTISDGISLQRLLNTLMDAYTGQQLAHCTLYSQYAQWYDLNRETTSYQDILNYWNNWIKNTSYNPYLKNEHSLNIDVKTHVLTASCLRKINQWCKQQKLTLQHFFLYCYYLLLSKKLNNCHLTIGTLFTGRNFRELDKIQGVFVNLLPVFFQYDKLPSIEDGLSDLKKQQQCSQINSNVCLNDLKQGKLNLFEFIYVYQVPNLIDTHDSLVVLEYADNGLGTDSFVFEVRKRKQVELITKYDSRLFSSQDIDIFFNEIKEIADFMTNNALDKIKKLQVAEFYNIQDVSTKLSVMATFTIEPILPFLTFWSRQVGAEYHFQLGDFNQVIQSLLSTKSILYQNKLNLIYINLLMLRTRGFNFPYFLVPA